MTTARQIDLYLTAEQVAILQQLEFPCMEPLLQRVERTRHGQRVSGTCAQVEELLRWVAGEANHSNECSRRGQLLHEIADVLEAAVAPGPMSSAGRGMS